MWPKALLELLPHLTRLVPLLNRYFQGKGTNDDATCLALERKLDEVAKALRNDVKDAAEASITLAHQLKTQSTTLTQLAADTSTIKLSLDSLEARMSQLEKRSGRLTIVIALALIQTIVVCVLLVVTLYQLHSWVGR